MRNKILILLPFFAALFFLFGFGSTKVYAASAVYTYPNTITFSDPSGCSPAAYDVVISATDYPDQGDGTVYEYSYVYHNSDFPLNRRLSTFGMDDGHTYYAMLLCDGNGFAQADISFVYTPSPTATPTPTPTATPTPTNIPTPTPTPRGSSAIVYTSPNTITFSNPSGCGSGSNYDIAITQVNYPTQGDGTVYDYEGAFNPSQFPITRNISGYGLVTGNTYYAFLMCDDTGFAQADISFVK